MVNINADQNPEYVNSFLDYSLTILNKSPNSVKEYNYDLTMFLRYIKIQYHLTNETDFKSITISAASVIAKVTRDRMLDELDKKYPMYDFKDNKGYPTKKHLAAIEEYGIIPEHRKSYGPVRDYLEKQLSLFQE